MKRIRKEYKLGEVGEMNKEKREWNRSVRKHSITFHRGEEMSGIK